ncbi:phage Gp37/Gp68 family protein [Azospirillum picis]|uniref:Protein gp37 n=1 Tax=Azospirillum picis TaxID=488438 RepID=A0ABU0MEF7_9PROT|nr:phage Gp37/Gp68 family protein [Azospirillum picis]MBP2297974.1 protein gp37 [Azospirillum picis]MDQ0531812.1 protein gp37 [Azospirillum picis]
MGDHCTIEWVVALARQINAIPASLNPIRGCSRLSEACRNCYAASIAHRFGHKGNGVYAGLTNLDPAGTPRFNGTLRWVPEVLNTPINAKRSRVYFVCDMSDLFHGSVEQDWIDQVYAMMALCRHHHFLLLTKRPDRMRHYLASVETPYRINRCLYRLGSQSTRAGDLHLSLKVLDEGTKDRLPDWPLPNVWTGATVEDQSAAIERVPHLSRTPSAGRFLSCEPLRGALDLTDIPFSYNGVNGGTVKVLNALTGNIAVVDPVFGPAEGVSALDWVICGGESGPRARPSHPDWVRTLRDQCAKAGVPFLFKQHGEFREFDTGSPAVEVIETDDEFSNTINPADLGAVKPVFVAMDGRSFAHFTDVPEGLPVRLMERLGKKAAGRLLDGRTWDEVPEVA